jgi:hypothetical protein
VNMKLTTEQIGLLISVLNGLFSEDNYDGQNFMKSIATDDLEELWELRSELVNNSEENTQ